MKSDNEKVFYAALGEYADVIDPHPSHRAPEEVANGYPFLGIGDIDYFGTAAFDKVRHVDVSVIEDHEKSYIIDDKTIGYAKMGNTIGKIVSFPDRSKQRYAVSPALSIINPKPNINPWYLRAVVESYEFWGHVNGKITGSTRPSIGIQQLRNIPIPVFPNEIQEIIGGIWKVIYDKISLNMKINENLLQQMEALYRAWFTDFVPFDGNRPANWKKSDIYSIANIIYGAPFASKLFNTNGEGVPIIRIRDLKEQAFVTYTTENHPKGHLIHPGDIVVGMDGEFRPYIWGNTEAWLNQRVCIFDNKRSKGKAFVLFTIKPLLFRIEQTQVATTVIHIGKKDYDAFEFYLPDNNVLDQFDEITSPMIDQIVVNCLENKRLEELRDVLLPQLMSGKLDISALDL